MRSEWAEPRTINAVLSLLSPANELVFRVCLETGLRVSDVLSLKTELLKKDRFTVSEMKTGKRRSVRLRRALRDELYMHAGRLWVFEGRSDWHKPRTRQAVYKDVARVSRILDTRYHITPHSARKVYAADLYKRTGDLNKVQHMLNHTDPAVTLLYALSDQMAKRKVKTRPF